MMALQNAAYQHQSAMNQASFDAFLGGFAEGFGAMDGNYELAGAGVGGVADAANRADVAGYSLNQIQERYNTIAKRREEIVAALR
jgi:hypothetical protein